jgi:hypothetical protein
VLLWRLNVNNLPETLIPRVHFVIGICTVRDHDRFNRRSRVVY